MIMRSVAAILFSAFATACISAYLPTAASAEQRTALIEGKIVEVVPSKKEIYVRNDDGKHEFYFNESTTVSAAGSSESKPAQFADLKTGQRVKVAANKIGKRLDPVSVEIIQ